MKKKFDIVSKIAWGLVAFLVVVLVAGIVTRVVINQNDKKDNEPMKQIMTEFFQEEDDYYDDFDMEELFMEGCIEEAIGQDAYCQCAYDYMEKIVGDEGLGLIAVEFLTADALSDDTAELMAEAVMDCIDEYKY